MLWFLKYDHQRVSMLADRLVQKIMSEIPEVIMNGDPEQRYHGMYTHTHTNKHINKSITVLQKTIPFCFIFVNISFYKSKAT